MLAILVSPVVLASLSLMAQREEIEWHGPLLISVLVFVGWVTISVFWSQYNWATDGSAIYLLLVTMLGIYIALIHDTIQITRAFGNLLRAALMLSLVLQIFSGVLIDSPIQFLSIASKLNVLGPIQGIFGTRNQLGIATLAAIVTFGKARQTQSIPHNLALSASNELNQRLVIWRPIRLLILIHALEGWGWADLW